MTNVIQFFIYVGTNDILNYANYEDIPRSIIKLC